MHRTVLEDMVCIVTELLFQLDGSDRMCKMLIKNAMHLSALCLSCGRKCMHVLELLLEVVPLVERQVGTDSCEHGFWAEHYQTFLSCTTSRVLHLCYTTCSRCRLARRQAQVNKCMYAGTVYHEQTAAPSPGIERLAVGQRQWYPNVQAMYVWVRTR